MLLKQNLTLYRVIKITWRIDLAMIALCAIAYYVDTYIFPSLKIPGALPTLVGTALAFFIGFSNNEAYNRWWEARIIWGGLVNDSRTWARNLLFYTDKKDVEVRAICRRMIFRHIAFLYALKGALRKHAQDESYKQYLLEDEVDRIERHLNKPSAILDLQSDDLQYLSNRGVIDGFRFLTLNEMIKNFCDGMGKSERINNTVFPTQYIYFTRLFIWFLVVLLTMTLSQEIGPTAILFGWMIGFVFHATHTNGMSIMNPFEYEAPAIPLDSITRTIEINLLQTLEERNIPMPIEPVNGEFIL